jgi:ankyrin repeat protein
MKTIPAKCADYIRMLVAQGADINQRDEYGDTALRIARDDGRQGCVEILGELGALE